MYSKHTDRLKLHGEYSDTEVGEVIKGTTRSVIVVKSPDPKVFEEAIFIVREEYMRSGGVSRAQLLEDAHRAADGYIGGLKKTKRGFWSSPALMISLSAVSGTGLGFLLMTLLT